MHRSLVVLLALAASGCARRVYSAPDPGPAPPSRVVLASSSSSPIPRATVSSTEAVDYLRSQPMQIPVAGVSFEQLRDTFDEGRHGGRVHRALDIMAPRGTPVLSAADGRIIRVSTSPLGGNTVYATDPLGRVVYYYAHLDGYPVGLASGAPVARGDTIGFVGTTGNAPKDTPHLHFQVMRMPADGKYWDGDPINPYPIILLTRELLPVRQ